MKRRPGSTIPLFDLKLSRQAGYDALELGYKANMSELHAAIGLMAKAGVECGVYYCPIFELTHYRKLLRLSNSHYPKAANAGFRVVSLPMWPGLKLKQVDQVCGAIEQIVRRHSG